MGIVRDNCMIVYCVPAACLQAYIKRNIRAGNGRKSEFVVTNKTDTVAMLSKELQEQLQLD
jgi:hypothetical protein